MNSFRRLLVVLLTASWLVSAASAADWPRFRGDGSASSPKPVPLRWSDTENIQWKAALPGRGASSPVVYKQRIYLTAFTGHGQDADDPGDKSKLELHVLCFDRTDGSLIWNRSIGASDKEQPFSRRVADHGYATNTVAVDDTGVYAFFGVSGVVAYDLAGKEKWRSPTGDKTAGFGSAASPVLHQDLVIVNCSIECGAVIAFHKQTGKEAYRIENVVRSWTTPLVVNPPDSQPELVISYKEVVAGHNPLTGKQLWACEGIQDYVVPCVVVNEDVVFVLGGRKNQSMAIRCGGRGEVTNSHKLWETRIGANVTSPIYHKGRLYWASDKGIACCVQAEDGKEVYRERISQTRSRIYASTVLAGQHLYTTTRDAGVIVVPLGDAYQPLGVNTIASDENLFNATPALSDGQLFLRSDNFLYCVGSAK